MSSRGSQTERRPLLFPLTPAYHPHHRLLKVSGQPQSLHTYLLSHTRQRKSTHLKMPWSWSRDETVVCLYFTSRRFSHTVTLDILLRNCNIPDRPGVIQGRIKIIRNAERRAGRQDPYDRNIQEWDLRLVDQLLSRQMDNDSDPAWREKLLRLIHIDRTVVRVLVEHVCWPFSFVGAFKLILG